MKKSFLLVLVVMIAISICGCIKDGQKKDLLEALKEEGIVDKNLKLVDEVTENVVDFSSSYFDFYIYENKESELIGIHYMKDLDFTNDAQYVVMIYNDVTVVDVEYIDATLADISLSYTYTDGKRSEINRYNMEGKKTYYVYEERDMFGNSTYEFEETEDEIDYQRRR